MVNEQMQSFRNSAEEIAMKARQHDSVLNSRIGELQALQADIGKNVADVHVRMDTMEVRLNQAVSGQAERYQRLNERQEQLLHDLASIRMEKQQLELSVQTSSSHIKELENSVARSRQDAEKLVASEGLAVRDELQRTQRKLMSDQGKQISELEMKVAERLEQESSSRESHTRQIYEEIGKASASAAARIQPPDEESEGRKVTIGEEMFEHSGFSSDTTAVLGQKVIGSASPSPGPARIFSVSGSGATVYTASSTLPVKTNGPKPFSSFGQAAKVVSTTSSPASTVVTGIVSPRTPYMVPGVQPVMLQRRSGDLGSPNYGNFGQRQVRSTSADQGRRISLG